MLYHDHFQETWKAITGFEGLYEASNTGKIRSIDRTVSQPGPKNGNYQRIMKGKEITQSLQNGGYYLVWLSKQGRVKALTVHRLVASAFIKNYLNVGDVNHKDGVKTNNHIENLEWCTRSENIKHAYATLLRKPKKA